MDSGLKRERRAAARMSWGVSARSKSTSLPQREQTAWSWRAVSVVEARALAEVDLAQEPRLLEVLQRVVDRGEADRGQLAPRRLEDLVGRQVLGRLRDDAEHGPPLRRQRPPRGAPLISCTRHKFFPPLKWN